MANKRIVIIVIGMLVVLLLGAACTSSETGQSADEIGVVYRSPT